jgi:ATP-binding cassette subfamily C protein CydC
MNGHTATGNGQATGVIDRNGHRARQRYPRVVTPLPPPSCRLPTFVRLALLVRPWWRGVVLNLTAALLNQSSGIALAVVSALLVARVATGVQADELPPYLVALAGFAVAKAVFTWLDMWFAHNVAYGMLAWLRSSAYNALEPLAPAYTLKRRSGDIVSMATADIETIELFFAHTLVPLMVMILVPTALLIGLAVVAWPLAVVLLPFLVLVASLPLLGRRWVDPVAAEVRRVQGGVIAHLVDSIQGLRELIAFGRGEARAAEVTAGSGRLGAAQQHYARFVGAVGGATETCVALGSLAVLLTSASLVAAGTVNRYQLPLILVMAFAAFLPVMNVAVVARNLNQVAAAARRYFEVVDEPVLVLEHTSMSPGTVPPAIAFDAVTFAYHPDEPPVLQDLSFHVQPGETVALVGPSGAGKSTCVSLLLRFWDPHKGAIRLGGVDLRDFPLDDLRQRIAIVQQDNYLFNTSIRENVRIGKPDATDDEIKAAARAANIHEFIVGLPDGYDTVVGERGAKLSGGQRQRLALARAFLKNAPILILDEATSNLDSENERLIKAAVARLMTGRTTLVIAHRLSTILSANRVIMIDRGQVVASGRHADLVAADGPYAQLIAAQRRHA